MEYYITKLRKEQVAMADKIAKVMFNEIKPYIDNEKYEGLETYVSNKFAEEINESKANPDFEFDKESLEAMVFSDLKYNAGRAIDYYTNWVGCRIVDGDYSIPTLDEIDSDQFGDEITEMVLYRTVVFMHSQKKLPLLGKVEKGKFKPDTKTFEEWKSFYGNWKD